MASLVGYSHLANDLGPANFPSVDPADLASKSLNMTRKSLGHSSATLNHSFETYHTIYLYVKHILFAGFFLYNVIQILSVFPFSEWCHKYSIFDLLLDPQLLLSKFLSGIKNGLVSLSTTGEPFRMDQLNALLIVFVPLFQLFNRYILHIKSDQEEVHLFNTLCCAVQVMLFSWIYQPKVILSSPIYSLMLLFYITSTLLSMNPSRFSSIFIYTKGQLLFR